MQYSWKCFKLHFHSDLLLKVCLVVTRVKLRATDKKSSLGKLSLACPVALTENNAQFTMILHPYLFSPIAVSLATLSTVCRSLAKIANNPLSKKPL